MKSKIKPNRNENNELITTIMKRKSKIKPNKLLIMRNRSNNNIITKNRFKTIKLDVYNNTQGNHNLIPKKVKSKSHRKHNKQIKIENGNIKGLKILHWNKGPSHLINFTHIIDNILEKHNPSILCLNEANIKPEHIKDLEFTDYKIEVDNLINDRGLARTAVIIHKDVSYTRLTSHEPKNTSTVVLRLGLKNNKKFILMSWYRQWTLTGIKPNEPNHKTPKNQLKRLEDVCESWENLLLQGYEVITIGDLNLDSIKWNIPLQQLGQYEKKFLPMINHLHQKILNNQTHKLETGITWKQKGKPGESLDFLFTNYPSKLDNLQVIYTGESDHAMISVIKRTKKPVHNNRYYSVRNFKDFSKETFEQLMTNDPKYYTACTNDDTNISTEALMSSLKEHLDTTAPIKRVQIKKQQLNYVTDKTKEIQIERNKTYEVARNSDDPDIWRKYRNLRNNALKSLRQDELNFKKSELKTENKTSKEIWNKTKKVLKWEKSKSPRHILNNGLITDSPKEMSEIFNKYYIEKVDKITQQIPTTTTDPMQNYKKVTGNKTLNFTIKTITMNTLMNTINKMKGTNSTGVDMTSMKTIKQSIKLLAPPILHIINTSITTNTFPECIKTARIIPLLKSMEKEPSLKENYRPINLIPWISKIFENIIKDQIIQHLSDNNLIPPQHSGGIKYNSTTTNVGTLLDMWSKLLDSDHDSILLQLDQSAAYDVVSHNILLMKLQILGMDHNSLQLIKSYCSNRSQVVTIEGYQSTKLMTGNRSVMQGSVLSTLLYLVYVLDFPLLFHNKLHNSQEDFQCTSPSGITFIDDLSVTIKREQQKEIQKSLDETLNKTSDYMNANLLANNNDKMKIMVLSRHPDMKKNLTIKVTDKDDIKHSPNIKILGIIIQDNLKLNHWIEVGKESILNQLRTRNTALKKIAKLADFKHRRTLANALFQSKLMYGIHIWGTAPKYLIQKIQVEQNNAARITCGFKSLRWSQDKLLKEMKWINIQNLIKLHSAILIHQVINTGKPEYFHLSLHRENNLPTRSSAVRKLGPKPRINGNTSNHNNTFLAKAYNIYNDIPDLITAIHNKKYFKTKLKRYLANNTDIPKIDDINYTKMIPDETLKLIDPNIDLSHKRSNKNNQKFN